MSGNSNKNKGAGPLPPVLLRLRRIAVRGFAFALVLSLFVNLLTLIGPLFMVQVYDRVITSGSVDTLTALVVIALGGLALYGVLEYVRGRTYHVLGNNVAARLSMPVLRGAVRNAASGNKASVTQALRDLLELRNFVSGNSPSVLLDAFWTPLFLVVLWMMHPAFVLSGLAAAAVLLALGVIGSVATRPSLNAAADRAAETYREMGSTSAQAEAVHAMGMVGPLARRWHEEQSKLTADYDRAGQIGKAFTAASRAFRLSVKICVLALGAYLVIERQITPGSMLAAAIITSKLLQPFEQLVDSWRQWVFARKSFARLRVLLDGETETDKAMPLPRPAGKLVADRLTVYPAGAAAPILREVSFAIEPGEVLGVIGPSGAGKSTLARTIVGSTVPTAGGIYLDEHSTHTWERENFGAHVGYLPQGVALLDGSVRENIARMREDADPALVVEAARAVGIHDILGKLPHGYETQIGPNGFGLSGGQVQRLGLARAVYDSPAVLVLDEPNSNLDSEGEAALDRVIRRAKAVGTSVIVIAHRPSAVAQADKLLVLVNGRVEQFGTRAEVLSSGRVQAPRAPGVAALRPAPAEPQPAAAADDGRDLPTLTAVTPPASG